MTHLSEVHPRAHPFPWDIHKLYIHLTDRGYPGTFHWSLFLTGNGGLQGWVYHVYDPEPGRWVLEMLGPPMLGIEDVLDLSEGNGGLGDGLQCEGEGKGGADGEGRGLMGGLKGGEGEARCVGDGGREREFLEGDGKLDVGVGGRSENKNDRRKENWVREEGGWGLWGDKMKEEEGVETGAERLSQEEGEGLGGANLRNENDGDDGGAKRKRKRDLDDGVKRTRNEDGSKGANGKCIRYGYGDADRGENFKNGNYEKLARKELLAAIEIGADIRGMKSIIEDTISGAWETEKKGIGKGDKICRAFLLKCIEEMEAQGVLAFAEGKGIGDLESEAKEFGMLSDPALNPGGRKGRVWKSRVIC